MEDNDTVSETGDFDINAAAAELTGESGGAGTTAGEEAQLEGQSGANPDQANSDKPQQLEDILNQMAANPAKPEDVAKQLEWLNGLGALHNGLPIKVDSPEQAKELMMKGFDYTHKTMAHAEAVRAKESEFSQKEAALSQKETALKETESRLQQVQSENSIMESLLKRIQLDDPDLFSTIANLYQREQVEFERRAPLESAYKAEFSKLSEQIQGLKSEREQAKQAEIRQGWEKELGEVQGKHAASLAKLGVAVDWSKVQQLWASDATGKMSVIQALNAAYGEDIQKAHRSHLQLAQTRNKTNEAILARNGAGSASRKTSEQTQARPGDYESLLRGAV